MYKIINMITKEKYDKGLERDSTAVEQGQE